MSATSKSLVLAVAGSGLALSAGFGLLQPSPVAANVKFAQDTGLSCSSCHSTPASPTSAALTTTGQQFRSCIYIPGSGLLDCSNQAITSANNAGNAQSPQAVYPGAVQNQATPPPSTPRKTNEVRDFILGLLGAPAATTQTATTPTIQAPARPARPNTAYTPGTAYDPGQRWIVVEQLGNGRVSDSSWARRQGTSFYDAVFKDSFDGTLTSDVIIYEQASGGNIQFRRQGTGTIYRGILTPDGKMVLGGTASNRPANLTWAGTVFDR